MKQPIWISYDLGIRGDYEGLYAWLDEHGAKECGDSIAYLEYQYSGELAEALKSDLQSAFDVTKKTRIYAIYRGADKKTKGRFVFGSRKAAPWTGHARVSGQTDIDEA